MSREDFAKTTQYLKENGAKFNSARKAWYVTRDQDLSRFAKYLHKPEEPRASTVRKLADCRKEATARAQNQPVGESEKKHEAAR